MKFGIPIKSVKPAQKDSWAGYSAFRLSRPVRYAGLPLRKQGFYRHLKLTKNSVRKLGSTGKRVLNQFHHDPSKQIAVKEICLRVVSLAQVLISKTYYPYQVNLGYRIVESLLLHDGEVITSLMARQSGKCLKEGTEVMLFSGETIPVEKVRVGDLLMGDDGTPRKVLELANGIDELYTVKPRCDYAEDYTVNSSHILSVLKRGRKIRNKQDSVLDISIKDYFKLSPSLRENEIMGYKARVPFSSKCLDVSPYWLGLWLGDGSSSDISITTGDSEILTWLSDYAGTIGLVTSYYEEKGNCVSVALVNEIPSRSLQNPLRVFLSNKGLLNNKHIPFDFKTGSRKQRLELLAGLIDSDGSLHDYGYEITLCNEQLAKDIQWISRSLGFRSSIKEREASCQTGAVSKAWRVNIFGETWKIPVRVSRKKDSFRVLRENPLTYGFDIVKSGKGRYFGFVLDGNKRFLLGDFTVTHNTETVGGIVAACAIILPVLAKQYPEDWKLNITDDQGNYRGFAYGLKVGIYAPRQDQAGITFDRVRNAFESKNAERILKELSIGQSVNNGNTVALSHGSEVKCESASEQSKIEGATHHLLIAEEAQDISDLKMRKSLHPMTASTMGTIVKIGTASTQKCDFYNAIQENRRMELLTNKRNHFFFPWTVCARFNSLYRLYIEKEKGRIGEDSDEFRMSYLGQWIFERGMFVTQEVLFNPETAIVNGLWANYYYGSFPGVLKHMPIVAGIDWGQSSDSTVVCLMAVDWLNPIESGETYDLNGAHRYTYYKKHVIGWIEFLGDNYEYQFGEVVDRLSKIPNLKKIVMDSNTCGKPLYDRASAVFAELDIEVEPFNFQAKLKSSGYQLLSADLWSGRTTFPAGTSVRSGIHYRKFVTQMLDLKKEYKNNIMHVSHPDERGAHDDYCDGFMLANWGASTPCYGSGLEAVSGNPFMD